MLEHPRGSPAAPSYDATLCLAWGWAATQASGKSSPSRLRGWDGSHSRTSLKKSNGSAWCRLQLPTTQYKVAAARPPRSLSTNKEFLRPMAWARTLRDVVVDAQLAISGVGLKIFRLISCIPNRLTDRALGGNVSTWLVQPLAECFQERDRIPLSDHATILGRESAARPLDLEELPGSSHCLVGRQRGRVPGVVELATDVSPASHANQVRPGAVLIVPGEGIGPEITREGFEEPLGPVAL